MIEDELKTLTVPKELKPYIGDYYTALRHRAGKDLVGESEFRCFERFLNQYKSGKYKFAFKGMENLFKFLHLLIYIDEAGRARHLELYPVQKFIMCGIFGLRHPDGRYLVNTANIYMARRNGKSFLLSGVLHYLMSMSKFRNETIILASCKGQNATICFKEFVNFIDNDCFLRATYGNVNRTACWAKNKLTGNELDMFRTGAGAKKSLDGFTNRVAVIDEEMLCDEIITKTIQDGQAHYQDSLLVTMSTAQFDIGGQNHKKWLQLRKELYEDALPDERFLFLCEPDRAELAKKDFTPMAVWGKANPVLLFEQDGYAVKDFMRKKYAQKAKEAAATKGFNLQNFATKQCNVWYAAEDRNLCTYDQMKACAVEYGFNALVEAGYTDCYLGIDLSHTLDLTSVAWITPFRVDDDGDIVPAKKNRGRMRLFFQLRSWIPKNRLQQHVERDQFPYRDYVGKELLLCTGAGGESIDAQEVLEYILNEQAKHNLHYVTIASDPYGVAGIQARLAESCDTFILQTQTPKALSQYIEIFSNLWKDGTIAYEGGHEDILEKAMMNAVMFKNSSGYYSIEKVTLRADSNIRIDPVDAALTGFIAPYIDLTSAGPTGDEAIDDWLSMVK